MGVSICVTCGADTDSLPGLGKAVCSDCAMLCGRVMRRLKAYAPDLHSVALHDVNPRGGSEATTVDVNGSSPLRVTAWQLETDIQAWSRELEAHTSAWDEMLRTVCDPVTGDFTGDIPEADFSYIAGSTKEALRLGARLARVLDLDAGLPVVGSCRACGRLLRGEAGSGCATCSKCLVTTHLDGRGSLFAAVPEQLWSMAPKTVCGMVRSFGMDATDRQVEHWLKDSKNAKHNAHGEWIVNARDFLIEVSEKIKFTAWCESS